MNCNYCKYENINNFNYCNSCGKKNERDASNNNPELKSYDSISSIKLLCETVNCYFDGKDYASIHNEIGESFGQKNALNIVYNLYLTEKFLIVLPVSKDKSGISLAALAFGSGAIGAIALGLFAGLAKKLESKNAEIILAKDDPFYNALIFETKGLNISVKEIRSQSPDLFDIIFAKETWVQFAGFGIMRDRKYDVSISFGFAGKAEKSEKYKLIVDVLKIKPPKIYKEKPFPF